MANEQDAAAAEAAPRKAGPGILVVLIVALSSAIAGAGGAYFVLDQRIDEAKEAREAAAAEPAEPASYADRLLTLEPFIVNVGGEGYARFLKLTVALEADSMEARGELEARSAQVRDSIILLLSSKRLADVGEFEGKALLKQGIRDRGNRILPEGRGEAGPFTDVVVQ